MNDTLQHYALDVKTYTIPVALPIDVHPFRADSEGDFLSQAMEGRRCAFGFRDGMPRAGEMVMVSLSFKSDSPLSDLLSMAYVKVCYDAECLLGAKARYEVHMIQEGTHFVGLFWFAHRDFAHALTWDRVVPTSLEDIRERPIHGGGTFLAGRHTAPDEKA